MLKHPREVTNKAVFCGGGLWTSYFEVYVWGVPCCGMHPFLFVYMILTLTCNLVTPGHWTKLADRWHKGKTYSTCILQCCLWAYRSLHTSLFKTWSKHLSAEPSGVTQQHRRTCAPVSVSRSLCFARRQIAPQMSGFAWMRSPQLRCHSLLTRWGLVFLLLL